MEEPLGNWDEGKRNRGDILSALSSFSSSSFTTVLEVIERVEGMKMIQIFKYLAKGKRN